MKRKDCGTTTVAGSKSQKLDDNNQSFEAQEEKKVADYALQAFARQKTNYEANSAKANSMMVDKNYQQSLLNLFIAKEPSWPQLTEDKKSPKSLLTQKIPKAIYALEHQTTLQTHPLLSSTYIQSQKEYLSTISTKDILEDFRSNGNVYMDDLRYVLEVLWRRSQDAKTEEEKQKLTKFAIECSQNHPLYWRIGILIKVEETILAAPKTTEPTTLWRSQRSMAPFLFSTESIPAKNVDFNAYSIKAGTRANLPHVWCCSNTQTLGVYGRRWKSSYYKSDVYGFLFSIQIPIGIPLLCVKEDIEIEQRREDKYRNHVLLPPCELEVICDKVVRITRGKIVQYILCYVLKVIKLL